MPAGEQQAGEASAGENGHAKPQAPSLAARPDPLVSLKELVRSLPSSKPCSGPHQSPHSTAT